MKIAQVVTDGGTKSTKEVVLILSKEEAQSLVKLMENIRLLSGIKMNKKERDFCKLFSEIPCW